MAVGSLARGGETACTPPQAGQLCTKVSSTKGFPQPWQLCSRPLGSADSATDPPWAFRTNSTNALPEAKGPTPGVRDDPQSHISIPPVALPVFLCYSADLNRLPAPGL